MKQPTQTHAEPRTSTIVEMIPVGGDVLDHAICRHCGGVILRQYPNGEWGHVRYRAPEVSECGL